MVNSVVKKGQFCVVMRVFEKRPCWVVVSVVKRGSIGWLLAWLQGAVLGGY